MKEAADAMGLSYDLFRRRFKRLVGVSPIGYQLRCRTEKACGLLQNHSVKQTAMMLEYDDPFVFSRQFKKLTGVSPREYKRGR